jgi:hypothetical protein
MATLLNYKTLPRIVDLSSNNKNVNVQTLFDGGISAIIARMSGPYPYPPANDPDCIDPLFYNLCDQAYNVDRHDGTFGMPFMGYAFDGYTLDVTPLAPPDKPSAEPQFRSRKAALGKRYVNVLIDDLEDYKMADGTESYTQTTDPNLTGVIKQLHDWNKLLLAKEGDTARNPYCVKQLLYTRVNFVTQFCKSLIVAIDGNGPTSGWDLWLAAWLWSGVKAVISQADVTALLPASYAIPTLGNWTEHTKMVQLGQVSGLPGCSGGIDIDVWVGNGGTLQSLYDYCGFKPRGGTPVHTCPANQHWDETKQACVDDPVNPPTDLEARVKALEDWRAANFKF